MGLTLQQRLAIMYASSRMASYYELPEVFLRVRTLVWRRQYFDAAHVRLGSTAAIGAAVSPLRWVFVPLE